MEQVDAAGLPVGGTIAVISPHLDDAVLGCGDLIAARPGATVITVFAGRPAVYPAPTTWDVQAGFGPADDVVDARREEDRAALSLLAARSVWLDFPDTQYGQTPTQDALAEEIERAIRDAAPDTVVMPLGLFHGDHRLTAAAALRTLRRRPDLVWLAYADAIYRRVPSLLDERVRALRAEGIDARPVGASPGPASSLKRRAVGCYASQIRALVIVWEGGQADAYEPEQHWSLSVAADGTDRPSEGGIVADDR